MSRAHGQNAAALLPGEPSHQAAARSAAPVAVDPICGMDVDVAAALYRFAYREHTYVFCGAHCRASFAADPERYLLPLGSP